MKHISLRFVLLCLCLLSGIDVIAYDAEIDGIYYNLSGDEAEVTYKEYQDYSGSIVIPESITFNGKIHKVTSIGDNAFRGCNSLTSVTIPNSVTSIGGWVFVGCTSLSSITIPERVTSFGVSVFYECPNLTSVTIECPNFYYWFSQLSSIKHVTLGEKVTSIGYHAFYDCSNLTSITIGNSVTTIDGGAFENCTSLKSITIPNSVTSIGWSAFYRCFSLTSITIGNGVTCIGDHAFTGCRSLTSITIPESVINIDHAAFMGCSSLTTITIPESVTSIGTDAFSETAWYNNQPDGLVYAGKVAYNYKGTMPEGSRITIEDGTLGIAGSAFSCCTGLSSIIIPNSVTSIGDDAFYCCTSLKKVSFSKNVEEIGTLAFSGCDSLQIVRANWQIPLETPDDTFSNTVYKNATLYIPGGSMPAYQATSCWKNFLNIRSMQYEVKVMATTGGSVKVNGGEAVTGTTQSYWIDCDATVTFDFIAEENCYLKSVTINGEDVTDQIENGRFTIASLEGDVNVIATFVPNAQYTVTASVVTLGGSGATEGSLDTLPYVVSGIGGFVTVSDSIVISGQSSTLTITPNDGYELKSVTVNGEDKTAEVADSVLTLSNIQENKVVVVTFQKQRFSVTAAECEGGNISLSATEVEWGESVTVIVTADEGYEIASLVVGDKDISESVMGLKNVKCTINCVTKDIEVIATFRLDAETAITLTAEDEGTSDDDPVYDLSGRQITNSKSQDSKLRRGIYIRNGKKVMIK